MARKRKNKRIYSEVSSPSDITKINRMIRSQLRRVKTKPRITELVKRSAYLCTLTYSPGFRKKLRGKLTKARKTAREEYRKTAKLANQRLRQLHIPGKYDEVWG